MGWACASSGPLASVRLSALIGVIMNAAGPPVRGANISEWMERALELFRVTLLKCLPLATIAVLCSDVPNLYWILTGHKLSGGLPSDPTYWVLYVIGAALALYIASAV